jgi:lysine 6-dehydrogenase
MDILILGSGLMGRAIAFDLCRYSDFREIAISDKENLNLKSAEKFLKKQDIKFLKLDLENIKIVKKYFKNFDIVVSAVPYKYNYILAKIAIDTKTHFIDLGGNNDIVKKELGLSKKAKNNGVIIIPDCGLAPGLTSIITKDIVEQMDFVDYIKLRVGGLPQNPKPPLNYQTVFSPYGLINEYVEDAIILDHGKILKKKPMTEIETINFPKPFGELEAFLTSGGCSTLPYTFRRKIGYLDYKTIRYKGHCEKFKIFLDLGFTSEEKIKIGKQFFVPRDIFSTILMRNLPFNQKDVVLLKVFAEGKKSGKKLKLEYSLIDYYDEKNKITSMMRSTGYPVSIIAQMIQQGIFKEHGVFCSEKIIPCNLFFDELKKRDISIKKYVKNSD